MADERCGREGGGEGGRDGGRKGGGGNEGGWAREEMRFERGGIRNKV